MKIHWIVIIATLAGFACNNANLNKAPFFTGSTFVEEDKGSADAIKEEVLPPVPMPVETQIPEDKVSPPENISGSFLVCSEVSAATEASPSSVVNCGLREEKTNNKVNIKASYAGTIWSYEADGRAGLAVTMVDLPTSLEWHVAITLKAATLPELLALKDGIRFYVSVVNEAGIKFQESSRVSPAVMEWLALNGGQIPTLAAIGGTQDGGRDTLFLCRMYVGAEVVPGKLSIHSRNSNKSMCRAIINGSAVQSQNDDGDTMIFKTDVLVINKGVFDNHLEWIPATNGLKPAQAIITGTDTLGNPLYTCRNLQADADGPGQIPGVLRPGSSSCEHEFNGAESNTVYQVLAWKGVASKTVISSQSTSTSTSTTTTTTN